MKKNQQGYLMGKKYKLKKIVSVLTKIANNIEKLGKENDKKEIFIGKENAYSWNPKANSLIPIKNVNSIPIKLLVGIDNICSILLQNTKQFALGYSANNALLWGARGMGKSSLIKSVHLEISSQLKKGDKRLILVEINREDLSSLPILMRAISLIEAHFLIFCDDLSFEQGETEYKSLKTVLDGGLEGRPKNVLFYATSNRRHLMQREMIENERSSAINPSETVEEKISLSDRFGLWLGFHHCDQQTYLKMVNNYIEYYNIDIDKQELEARAIEWATTRGARSGRIAIQFVRHLAGQKGISLN